MKTIVLILSFVCSMSAFGQSRKKDTVKLDSTHVEKIRKMPMDTSMHKMPVVPLPPPQNQKSTIDPIRRKDVE